MLNLLLAILVGCAQPTPYEFCVQYQEEMCACDPENCNDQQCDRLDLDVHCDPQASTFSAKGCEVAHLNIEAHPWECIADAMATCDDAARIACYPEEQR